MAISERGLVYPIPDSEPEIEVDVSYLTTKQIGMYKLRAMGFLEKEIAVKTGKAYSTVKNEMHCISGGYNAMEIIVSLINSGGINRTEIAEGLNFESYDKLTRQRKQILEQIAKRESWRQTGEEIAQSLHISLGTFKNRMEATRKKLGVSNMLRLRVFMFLREEHNERAVVFPDSSNQIEVNTANGSFVEDLRNWGRRRQAEMHSRGSSNKNNRE